MHRRALLRVLATLAAAAAAAPVLLLAACSEPGGGDAAGGAGGGVPHQGVGKGDHSGGHRAQAFLAAAASLGPVIESLRPPFEAIRGSHLVANCAASGTLAQQIRQGATPCVFVAADAAWADRIVEWDLAEPDTRIDLLTNALVVVVPKGASERPARLEDLRDARWTRIAVGDPKAAPAGAYAEAAMAKAGVLDAVRGRLVAAADVRTALAYVERGDAPVGIVYATDAAGSDAAEVAFTVPAGLHPRIVYPMLVVNGANRRTHELYDFLRSPEARAAFEKAGFGVVAR